MTELKTLKDIYNEMWANDKTPEEHDVALLKPFTNDLRIAAKEWLEEYERLDEIAKIRLKASVNWGPIIFIKHFFNFEE